MTNHLYNLLRKDIEDKIGTKILKGKDCEWLLQKIFLETQRQISSSTIKRFFGFIKSNFNPSQYTLDTFSQFVGFQNWQDYVNYQEEIKNSLSSIDPWSKLKNSIRVVTNHSLSSLKQKTDFKSKKMFLRDFAKRRFEDFMESSKNAMMFIAPRGYGKSSMSVQLTEHYFLNENAKYKDDIVALIDGEIFFNIYSKNNSIIFLKHFLDFRINSSLGFYFANNPEHRKGRICIILDNVDEVFPDKEKYHLFIENLSTKILADSYDWFKIILTCRPENIDPFIYQINKNPVFESCWFETKFFNERLEDIINIPMLDKDEIETILMKNKTGFDYHYLSTNHNKLLNILGYPYMLFLFLEELEHGHNDFSEMELLNRYIHRKLISRPYLEGKLNIIDQFLTISKWGKDSSSIKKKSLKLNANDRLAYNELISNGIFYEYIEPHNLLENQIYVRFNQMVVFEYIVFDKWISSRKLNTDLYFEIRDYYKNNTHLQCNLLNFYTRTLIHDNNFKILNQLHIEFDKTSNHIVSHAQLPPCINSISLAIKEASHTNSWVKEELIPSLSELQLGKLLYSKL